MNVLKGQISVLKSVQTLLEAIIAHVNMITVWQVMVYHASIMAMVYFQYNLHACVMQHGILIDITACRVYFKAK